LDWSKLQASDQSEELLGGADFKNIIILYPREEESKGAGSIFINCFMLILFWSLCCGSALRRLFPLAIEWRSKDLVVAYSRWLARSALWQQSCLGLWLRRTATHP